MGEGASNENAANQFKHKDLKTLYVGYIFHFVLFIQRATIGKFRLISNLLGYSHILISLYVCVWEGRNNQYCKSKSSYIVWWINQFHNLYPV